MIISIPYVTFLLHAFLCTKAPNATPASTKSATCACCGTRENSVSREYVARRVACTGRSEFHHVIPPSAPMDSNACWRNPNAHRDAMTIAGMRSNTASPFERCSLFFNKTPLDTQNAKNAMLSRTTTHKIWYGYRKGIG